MYTDTSYSEVEKQIYNQNVTIMPPNKINFVYYFYHIKTAIHNKRYCKISLIE